MRVEYEFRSLENVELVLLFGQTVVDAFFDYRDSITKLIGQEPIVRVIPDGVLRNQKCIILPHPTVQYRNKWAMSPHDGRRMFPPLTEYYHRYEAALTMVRQELAQIGLLEIGS